MPSIDPMPHTWRFGKTVFTTSDGSRLDHLLMNLDDEFPDLVLYHKRSSMWHWLMHILICIFTLGSNRSYIGSMTTTGKNSIGLCDKHWERLNSVNDYLHDRIWATLMHERIHLRQFRDLGRFGVAWRYICPPFILWVPSRAAIEKPGYVESIRAQWALGNYEMVLGRQKLTDNTTYKTWWVHCFTGSSYGWMLRFGGREVAGWYDTEVARLQIVNPPAPPV